LKESKKYVESTEDPAQKRRRNGSGSMIDFNSAKKAVQKSSPVVGFSKTQRFKTPNNYDLDSSRGSVGSVDSSSTVDSIGPIRTKSPVVLFGKSQRFQQTKKDTNREFDLNPKFDIVKRREPTTVIKSPLKIEKKKNKIHNQVVAAVPKPQDENADGNVDESMETVRLENIQRIDQSDIFSDTTEIGPGAYNVNYAGVEVRKSVGFPKSVRFKSSIYDEGTVPLNPKYEVIKKGVPSVKIAKELPKNEKLLKKKTQEEFYQNISNQIRRETPLDNDIGVRRNIPNVVMKDAMENLTEKERLMQIFNLVKFIFSFYS